MRGTVYVIAAIVAAGIVYAIATAPEGAVSTPVAENSVGAVDFSQTVATSAGSLSLSVPMMHCEFACFPRVKETLEASDGVEAVTLAEQQQEGVLDKREVIVKYQPGFDLQAALASLDAAGYKNSDVVQ